MMVKIPISERQIKDQVKSLSFEIFNFLKEKRVNNINAFIVLIGGIMFGSDLLRELSKRGLDIETKVISVNSYKGIDSGMIKINENDIVLNDLNGKNILVIDDILDTGKTLTKIRSLILKNFSPKILEFCCFLRKEIPTRDLDFSVKFIGFDIPNQFVIGYGLDFNGKYRELPFVTDLKCVE